MAKASPPSNRAKGGSGAKKDIVPNHKGGSKAKRILAPKRELSMAARILHDIRENASDLSKRADRLLKRVS
jgi:hypothetical protein